LLDVVWGSVGGIAIGAALGTGVARLVVFLRRRHKEAVGLDDFLALGLIAGAYGVALLVHASGFLAVFAAGAAVRRMERNDAGDHPGPAIPLAAQSHIATPEHALHVATAEETATAYMAQAVLAFNEQVERIGEVAAVIVLGGLLSSSSVFSLEALLLGVTLFFVVRPVAVATGLARAAVTRTQARLIAWFGVRGIGSLYYLAYAVTHGLPPELVDRIGGLVLCVVALSVIVHGVSVTPAMSWYGRRRAQPA
jgi:NhaP-type Na+/H+ or K+/H+ antiporter